MPLIIPPAPKPEESPLLAERMRRLTAKYHGQAIPEDDCFEASELKLPAKRKKAHGPKTGGSAFALCALLAITGVVTLALSVCVQAFPEMTASLVSFVGGVR